ncbi:hypothetical protein DYB35_000894 [Aphanomyces astaci]|uniref:Stealth protein CR2 conserved region 2 domain-containing protein n=1 Tax=Aphanomyces astaci TaxID=112090 RepID=A0A418CNQ3_APHAT|nr:hypothetical protein DYB35_000894 [Aphanomyces astaci]
MWEEGVLMDEVTAFGSLSNSQDTYPGQCRIRNYDALKRMSIVYTWVNGSVPCYRECRRKYGGDGEVGGSRDRESGELMYSIRSLRQFLPWHEGTVYIVAPSHAPPHWLNHSHPRIHVIHQDSLFPSSAKSYVPTFNTNVIEQFLYRIPGLSDLFMHMNDDYIFTAHVRPHDLFTCDGGIKLLHEPSIIGRPTAPDPSRGNWMQSVLTTRDAIDATLGYTPTRHFLKHAPFVYSRRALVRVHQLFTQQLRATLPNRFRGPHDMNVPLLHHAYVLALGKTELGIPVENPPPTPEFQLLLLTDTNQEYTKKIFAATLNRRHGAKLLALNDEFTDMAVADTVRTFLATFLPVPSAFELEQRYASVEDDGANATEQDCCTAGDGIVKDVGDDVVESSNSLVLRVEKPPSMAISFFRTCVHGAGFALGIVFVLAAHHHLVRNSTDHRHHLHTETDGKEVNTSVV